MHTMYHIQEEFKVLHSHKLKILYVKTFTTTLTSLLVKLQISQYYGIMLKGISLMKCFLTFVIKIEI